MISCHGQYGQDGFARNVPSTIFQWACNRRLSWPSCFQDWIRHHWISVCRRHASVTCTCYCTCSCAWSCTCSQLLILGSIGSAVSQIYDRLKLHSIHSSVYYLELVQRCYKCNGMSRKRWKLLLLLFESKPTQACKPSTTTAQLTQTDLWFLTLSCFPHQFAGESRTVYWQNAFFLISCALQKTPEHGKKGCLSPARA